MHDLLLSVAPPRVRQAAAHVEAAELAMMEADDEKTQMRVRRGAVGVGRRRRLRHRGALGRLLHVRARDLLRQGEVPRAHDAVRRRAEAARPGGAAPRPRPGAAARRARQLPRRPGQALARGADPGVAEDRPVRQPRPRADEQHRDPDRDRRARRRRQHGLGPPGWLRDVPRRPSRPLRPARGAAPPLGRGARQAQGARAPLQDQGGVQRRHGLAVPGCPDPAPEVRGGRAAAGHPARAERQDAAARAAAPASVP